MDLDQTLAEAHCTTGMLNCWYGLDWPSVGRNFHIALSLAPTQITALLWQSLYFQAMGRHEQSIASARRARESEPLSPITNMYLGVAFMNSGQCDLAIRQLKQAIELDPQTYRPHMFLGIAYQLLERYQDAMSSFSVALSMNPENLESIGYKGVVKAKQGDRRGALEVVDQLKKTERTDSSNMIPLIYASLGEDVEVFRWLELARDRRSAPIYLFLLDPKFRDYESHPKYRSFCDSIGLHRCATA
jgi:tetratricopeptide (TPR) repeat protein